MHNDIRDILVNVQAGTVSVEDALVQLKQQPFEDLGFAKVDLHRKRPGIRRLRRIGSIRQKEDPPTEADLFLHWGRRLQQRPLKVFKQQTAADVCALGQQEHGDHIFHSRVRGHVGIIAVDGINGVIDRIHGMSSQCFFFSLP